MKLADFFMSDWMSHWIIHSPDSLKNDDLFQDETMVCCSAAQPLILLCLFSIALNILVDGAEILIGNIVSKM